MWHYSQISANHSKGSSQSKRNHGYKNLLRRVLNQQFRKSLKDRTAKGKLVLLGGPDYMISGNVLKIYLLICILLDILERFHQFVSSHLFVEVKHQSKPDMLKCPICNCRLGDWYDPVDNIHYICKLPTDKNGVLI